MCLINRFRSALKSIYIIRKGWIDLMLERENYSNRRLETYIAESYAHLFEDHRNIKDGKWDEATARKLVEALIRDGTLRFLLEQKKTKLESKHNILKTEIIPLIEEVISGYEN